MIFRQITFGTPEYEAEVRLREEVLRKPLGLKFDPQDLLLEQDYLHFGLYEQENLVATLQFIQLSTTALKMRQVAVSAFRQREGLGRILVEWSEKWARERGYRKINLHARKSVVTFYEKLSYQVEGEEFLEVGIPHLLMSKNLYQI